MVQLSRWALIRAKKATRRGTNVGAGRVLLIIIGSARGAFRAPSTAFPSNDTSRAACALLLPKLGSVSGGRPRATLAAPARRWSHRAQHFCKYKTILGRRGQRGPEGPKPAKPGEMEEKMLVSAHRVRRPAGTHGMTVENFSTR